MRIRRVCVSAGCAKIWLALALSGAVSGCGGGGSHADLEAFMEKVESRPPGQIEPLPPFEEVPPFAYQASSMRAPFAPPVVVKRVPGRNEGPKVEPDLDRPKQFLEQFPIGDLTMVGTLAQGSEQYALVQDGEGGVHRVQTGDYMGTDHGKVEDIEETAIELIEIVPDGTGGWVERGRTVALGGGD